MSLVLPAKQHEPASGASGAGAPPYARLRSGARRIAAPLLAAVLAGGAYLAGWIARGDQPFGNRPRAFNDQANQYVPLHVHFWDLVHGNANGDLLFNWQSGFGTQFLSDYHTYLGNPLSLTVLVFPRNHVDVAMFLVTPLTIAVAAAVMTVYLKYLAAGPAWLRATLGACYAVCGWSIGSGGYIPMWMWGLVALPMLGIAMEWFVAGRRWVPGALLVTLAWLGNFYTAAMATVAAGLLLVVRLLLADLTWRARIFAAVRAGTATLCGIAVTAVLLYPTLLSSKASQPTRLDDFVPATTESFLASALPASYMPGEAPRLFVATIALVLALAFCLNRRIAPRARAAWTILVVATALSFQWAPTQLAWHGFSLPNGNSYRETFVFCAFVVIIAWMNAANRPRIWTLAVAAQVLVLLTVWLSSEEGFNSGTWTAMAAFGGISVTAFVLLLGKDALLGNFRYRKAVAVGAVVVLMAAVVGELAYSMEQIEAKRATERWARPAKTTGPEFENKRAAMRKADGWPEYRTESDTTLFNEPLITGGEGATYYSSYTPETTFRALDGIGFPWLNFGRTIGSMDNVVTDAILSIGARVKEGPSSGGKPPALTTERTPVPPLVTVHPDTSAVTTAPANTVWARQEAALGRRVYDVPQPTVTGDPKSVTRNPSGTWTVKPPADGAGPKSKVVFSGQCTPGSQIMWYAPRVSAKATSADGVSAEGFGSTDGWGQAGILTLGTVPASGEVRVDVTASEAGEITQSPIGCLDLRRFADTTAELTKNGAVKVSTGGHSLNAVLPSGSRGYAVVATTAVDGWTCTVDGRNAKPVGRNGFLAVPLGAGGKNVACDFTPPGMVKGAAVSGVGIAGILVGGLVVPWVRRRYDRRQVSVTVPQATDR
jgi:uncharacterized membrane protein YfhO